MNFRRMRHRPFCKHYLRCRTFVLSRTLRKNSKPFILVINLRIDFRSFMQPIYSNSPANILASKICTPFTNLLC